MIKNERQYQATSKQMVLLERDLEALVSQPRPSEPDERLFWQIRENAIRGQLIDLQSERREYDDLISGSVTSLRLDSIDDLPLALIAARLSSGLSQRKLAERVGIQEQMIQRYEASEYASASFSRLREIAQVLNVSVREDVLLPSADASISKLFTRLEQAGLNKDFIKTRVLPLSLRSEIESSSDENDFPNADVAVRAAASVGRVFGFEAQDAFGASPLVFRTNPIATASLKVSIGANERRLASYAIYAYHLSSLVLRATENLEMRAVPTTAEECRSSIREAYGEINYWNALRFVWDLGIPVLPLHDSGAFHGALWRINGRNVIVLKQRNHFSSRWLIDLLHELGHAGQDPGSKEFGAVEQMSDPLRAWKLSDAEDEAAWYAIDVALDGRAEELAGECARRTKGSLEALKSVVRLVARQAGTDVGVLADYMAFRLQHDRGDNWWATATNLQLGGTNPLHESQRIFWDRVDIRSLEKREQELIVRALTNYEGVGNGR